MGVQSFNHWTLREVPDVLFKKMVLATSMQIGPGKQVQDGEASWMEVILKGCKKQN